MLASTLCSIEVAPDLTTATIDDHTIVVVDSAIALASLDACKRPARAWIAVPGEGLQPAEPTAVSALLHAGWDHVVAHPMPLLAEELLATAQKLIRRDCFGLDKYMAWGAEVRSYTLEDAIERDAAVAAIASDVTRVGLPDRIGSLVSVVADELLANALYAAPVDDSGAKHRIHDPRDRSRLLTDRDVVSLRWSTDGRYLAIEVRDRWGTIEPAAIETRLAATKTSTAENGMGLPLAYACSNQLVLNVAPQALTEVIALLDIRYKPTELARSASFHAFWGELP